jgi:hypothetical protein
VQFAELVLSDEQALMTRAAIDLVLSDPERFVMTDEERADYERLAVFFGAAAVEPSRFPLSPRQADRIKSVVRKAKGPAQPQSRRNKRKARQERRQSFHKRRRQENRQMREQYHAAMEALERDRQEAEEAFKEMQAKYEAEPKFSIYSGDGQLIMSGVPKSAIVEMEESFGPLSESKVILPGTAEALGLDLETDARHALVPDE